jgi:predicted nucleic acid-binding protein
VALIVLDASVVIAHLDPADAHHERATGLLLEHADDDLRLPASAYAETLVDPARSGRLDEARDAIDLLGLRIEPIDKAVADRAASLRARKRALRLPDALVLACGEVLEADAIVTADRRWRRFERVRVIG